jgi:hypothetical protein
MQYSGDKAILFTAAIIAFDIVHIPSYREIPAVVSTLTGSSDLSPGVSYLHLHIYPLSPPTDWEHNHVCNPVLPPAPGAV